MKTLVEKINAGTVNELIRALVMVKQDYGLMLELDGIKVKITVTEEILSDGSKLFNLNLEV